MQTVHGTSNKMIGKNTGRGEINFLVSFFFFPLFLKALETIFYPPSCVNILNIEQINLFVTQACDGNHQLYRSDRPFLICFSSPFQSLSLVLSWLICPNPCEIGTKSTNSVLGGLRDGPTVKRPSAQEPSNSSGSFPHGRAPSRVLGRETIGL